MATITINIPDAVVPRVLDAIAVVKNYNAATDGTKAAFAKKQVGVWVKSIVLIYEAGLARTTAQTQAEASVESEIVIA